MAGRRPKPTAIKKVTGNPGGRPLPDNEVKSDGMAVCPDHLTVVAKAEWKRMAAILERLGLLTDLDQTALAMYCQAYSDWIDAKQQIQKLGPILKAPSGYPVPSPYLAIAKSAADLMAKMMVEFGMTPSSRTRLEFGAIPPPTQPRPDGDSDKGGKKKRSTKRDLTPEEEFFGSTGPDTKLLQ